MDRVKATYSVKTDTVVEIPLPITNQNVGVEIFSLGLASEDKEH
jgi:hypothetical protein